MIQWLAVDQIREKILSLRGQRVMLDMHLAELYGVETKALKRAVKRNRDRFPSDFCFVLTAKETESLRYHFDTSSWGGTRYNPFAFTEQGVAMLSSVLKSMKAIQVNISIMRAFVHMRELTTAHKDLRHKLDELERRIGVHDGHIRMIFEALRQLMRPPEPERRRIGF